AAALIENSANIVPIRTVDFAVVGLNLRAFIFFSCSGCHKLRGASTMPLVKFASLAGNQMRDQRLWLLGQKSCLCKWTLRRTAFSVRGHCETRRQVPANACPVRVCNAAAHGFATGSRWRK
ncbi:MAG: hypothetical protein KDI72_12685, partial [Xanthomonadales bacterium]|nr:hypothetical protein [Xanthomonadales bacterium]